MNYLMGSALIGQLAGRATFAIGSVIEQFANDLDEWTNDLDEISVTGMVLVADASYTNVGTVFTAIAEVEVQLSMSNVFDRQFSYLALPIHVIHALQTAGTLSFAAFKGGPATISIGNFHDEIFRLKKFTTSKSESAAQIGQMFLNVRCDNLLIGSGNLIVLAHAFVYGRR